jgi:hypothetical protein
MIDFSQNLLYVVLNDTRLDCLGIEEVSAVFTAMDNFSDLFSRFDPYLAIITENLRLLGKVLMRPRVIGQEFLLEGKHVQAKYIRFNTESESGTFDFKFNDLSNVALQAS